MQNASCIRHRACLFKATGISQPILTRSTRLSVADGKTWSLPHSQRQRTFLAQNNRLSSYMDSSPSFFEVLTLLCAIAWRHQPATDPEETSPLETPTTLSVGSMESRALAKGRNLRFAR